MVACFPYSRIRPWLEVKSGEEILGMTWKMSLDLMTPLGGSLKDAISCPVALDI